ncbi:uncharacterized protein LOC143254845 isoform X2 [Tachypleus tridentatus]|uniref:uncharacterized protein LOC143254845 isoform X2 n=1 Tax=Tachypleus tridentatus TaxID=6853 RepID=UPI003FD0C7B5
MSINSIMSEDKILLSPSTSLDVPNISLTEFLTLGLEKCGDKALIVSHDKSRSYTAQDVLLSSRRFASALVRRGLKVGDVFCICSANNIDFAAAALGAMNAGAIITLGKPMDKAEELCFRLEQTNSVYLLVEKKNLDKAKEATKKIPNFQEILVFEKSEDCPSFLELVEEDDGSAFTGSPDIDPKETPLLLTFSSGTTGLPKPIVHTHATFLSAVIVVTQPTVWKFSQDDIILGMYPFCHVGGFLFLVNVLYQGVTLSVVPSYESDLFLEVIETHKVSVALVAVSILYRLLRDPSVRQYNLTSLKEIITGGAPLNQEDSDDVLMNSLPFLKSFRQVYGLSEALIVASVEKGKTTPNSVGKLTPSTELKVVDLVTGVTLGPNEGGEFYVRSPQVMKGYLNNPKVTAEAFTEDGWLKTGDFGHYDFEGNLYITDRLKEMIKSGFHQVSPTEIETVLCSHEAVEDAAVVGIPNSTLGEVPYGVVVIKPGCQVTPENILCFISARLAPQKQLKGVEILDKIPRSSFGKIELAEAN